MLRGRLNPVHHGLGPPSLEVDLERQAEISRGSMILETRQILAKRWSSRLPQR